MAVSVFSPTSLKLGGTNPWKESVVLDVIELTLMRNLLDNFSAT